MLTNKRTMLLSRPDAELSAHVIFTTGHDVFIDTQIPPHHVQPLLLQLFDVLSLTQ